ncbi:cation transporter, partial [Acinetobacter baumannii]
ALESTGVDLTPDVVKQALSIHEEIVHASVEIHFI